jgi:citrate lyase synthetase
MRTEVEKIKLISQKRIAKKKGLESDKDISYFCAEAWRNWWTVATDHGSITANKVLTTAGSDKSACLNEQAERGENIVILLGW